MRNIGDWIAWRRWIGIFCGWRFKSFFTRKIFRKRLSSMKRSKSRGDLVRKNLRSSSTEFSTASRKNWKTLKWEAWGDRPLPNQEGREAVYRNGLAGGPDANKHERATAPSTRKPWLDRSNLRQHV